MIKLSLLSDYLDDSINTYKEKVLKDKYLLDTFGSKENLFKVIYNIREFLKKEFDKDEKTVEKDFETLGKYHAKLGIPFQTVLYSLFFIKDEIYKRILETEKYLLLTPILSSFFDTAINAHAKGYLYKSIEEHIEEILDLSLGEKSKYEKLHFSWLVKFLKYIKGEESTYPNMNAENCALNNFIKSFDFEIKAGNKEFIKKVESIHSEIHRYAKNLLFYKKNNEYIEAYFTYNNLINFSYKLLNFLNSIYVHFEKNKKNIFLDAVIKYTDKQDVCLSVVNILNLKVINRFYGEETGDKVIKVVKEKLNELLDYRKFSFIKGYSGEFYIFHKEKPKSKYSFAEKIKKELESITILGNIDLKFGVSISVLELSKIDSKEKLIKVIDYAVEEAKKNLSKIAILDKETIHENIINEIDKINQSIYTIEKAFSEGSIELYFQPIVHLKTGKVVFLETLARINNKGEIITAEEFINLIYNMKLIKKFDFTIFSKILEKTEKIKKAKEKLTVFVNVSPVSLSSSDFVKEMISTVEKAKKEGVNIVIELTEKSILENPEFIKFLKNEYNLTFAIDDFGTGYSSIRTVQDLSILGIIDYLKIDGALIKDISTSEERKKLVELIVSFAKIHGLKTVAEFVENRETSQVLEEIGVDYGQGFYFGKPKNLNEVIGELNEKYTGTLQSSNR